MDAEHDRDLFWNALNYRTASTLDADAMWLALVGCVNRLILDGVLIGPSGAPVEEIEA